MRSLRTARRSTPSAVGALLVVALVAVHAPAAADPQERLDGIEERRRRIQADQERLVVRSSDLSSRVQALDQGRAAAESRLDEVEGRLARLDSEIGRVRDEMATAQKKVAALSIHLDDIQESLAANQARFEKRAVDVYKAGPSAAMEGLLSADSFADLLERYVYYESALDADVELLARIQGLETRTEDRRDVVEVQQSAVARSKLALERRRTEVDRVRARRAGLFAARQAAVAEKRALLEGVRSRQDELAAVERQLDRESARIQGILSGGSSPFPSGSGARPSQGRFVWPAEGSLTSPYGYRVHPIFGDTRLHAGIDIGAAYGSSVWAADGGSVAFVGVMSGYGNVVVVDHGGGLATTYNHLSAFLVDEGRRVARGQQIGAVGCTGYCTGPHLHFEVRIDGTPVDPMPYLQ
ncbi:MAG: murein hydrolase activator EnvC family protein [Actinomycetota bacterium]